MVYRNLSSGEHSIGRSFLFFIFLVLIITRPLQAEEENKDSPLVLFLSISEDDAELKREKNIASRIAVTLSDFKITIVAEGLHSFRAASLAQRLELLKQITGINEAIATVWVEQSPGMILLNLVALSTGQALVRIVEAKDGPDTPDVLALTVQELLGQAYLFEKVPLQKQLRKTVQTVTQSAVLAKEERGETDIDVMSGKGWLLLLSSGARGGIAYFDGPSLRLAVDLGIARKFENGLLFIPEARFLYGPRQPGSDVYFHSIGAGLSLGLGYKLAKRQFSFTPQVSVAGVFQRTVTGIVGYDLSVLKWFNASIEAKFATFWHVSPTLSLGISPGISINTVRKFVSRSSDDSIVYSSPRLEWQVLAALCIHL